MCEARFVAMLTTLNACRSLSMFGDWPILPSQVGHLYRSSIQLKLLNADKVSHKLQCLLGKVGCRILDTSHGVDHLDLVNYVHDADGESVLKSIFNVVSSDGSIKGNFLQTLDSAERDELRQFFLDPKWYIGNNMSDSPGKRLESGRMRTRYLELPLSPLFNKPQILSLNSFKEKDPDLHVFQSIDLPVIGLTTLSDHRKFQVVPDDVKHMWNEWALRGLIVISLVSQITLSLLGNVRKYNPRTRVRMALWFAYLLALAVASSALGVITRTALDVCNNTSHFSSEDTYKQNTSQLMSFWAPFLLLHLGGPDSITAFALEDNELSLRHLCGFIKCFERIKALRLANTKNLRDSMLGPPDAVNINLYPEEGRNISEAYDLLQTLKQLFDDLILTFKDRDSSQSYFRHLKSRNAFYVAEIELGLSFDMLYTKANVDYSFNGILLRLTSISVLVMVPVGFYFLYEIDDYHLIDIIITYLLVGTTLIMDIFAVITMLRSDWTDHWLIRKNLTRKILILPFLKQPNKQRWSGSVSLKICSSLAAAAFLLDPFFVAFGSVVAFALGYATVFPLSALDVIVYPLSAIPSPLAEV
ncbi:hypothetical protein Tco_1053495 [Tanacetum coccineum]|uniref:DUF4220 domain-containing protein n=1 Tax=Tanacetum coccineum TaxID=301880 RepID=A0ABQ5GU24_9ASTR